MNRQELRNLVRRHEGLPREHFQANLEVTLTTGRREHPTKHSHRRQRDRSWEYAQKQRAKR
jgi:hypothetical protein